MATALRFLTGTLADFRIAARRLTATPLFTVFAIVSLALGLGVTTAVYSVVDALFLKGFDVREPHRVAFVSRALDGRIARALLSDPDFYDVRDRQQSFATMSASFSINPVVITTTMTELLVTEAVDGRYFTTLGAGAALGRTIQPGDEAQGARVAVLSHWLWRSRFNADPNVIGRTFQIAGQPFEVIGVAADTFNGLNRLPDTRLWIPLATEAALDLFGRERQRASRDQRRLIVFGRLQPSATVQRASAELGTIAASLNLTFPPTPSKTYERVERAWHAKTVAAFASDDNAVSRIALVLVALVALVLVVACTNLANLVLARGTIRRQEFTVRSALGAPRWRLVREQTAESIWLALGGAIGAVIVFQALRNVLDTEFSFFSTFGGVATLTVQTVVDGRVVAIAASSLLLSLVVFGLEPALQLTRSRDLRPTLAEGGGSVGSPRVKRQRRLLRYQIAISVGFFIIATTFVRYTIEEAAHDTGIEMERLAVAVVNLRTQQWEEARVRATLERVLEQTSKNAALQSVAITSGMPFGVRIPINLMLTVPGVTPITGNATAIAATPRIFDSIGVPIVRGRGFEERDYVVGARVIVISEFTARSLFGTVDAVGQTLDVGQRTAMPEPYTVIGVAGDTDVIQILDEPKQFVYLPLTRYDRPALLVTARSRSDAGAAVVALRDALRTASPDLPVSVVGTGRRVLAGQYVFLRAAGLSSLALGVLTLVLAMVGLFGIQSHVVAQRTREIGVRMSIGATAREIRLMVLKDGYLPVLDGLAFGVLIGVAGRAIIVRYLEIDVSVLDPWMFAVVPVPVVLAAFFACVLPAHRAARVDPVVALRQV